MLWSQMKFTFGSFALCNRNLRFLKKQFFRFRNLIRTTYIKKFNVNSLKFSVKFLKKKKLNNIYNGTLNLEIEFQLFAIHLIKSICQNAMSTLAAFLFELYQKRYRPSSIYFFLRENWMENKVFEKRFLWRSKCFWVILWNSSLHLRKMTSVSFLHIHARMCWLSSFNKIYTQWLYRGECQHSAASLKHAIQFAYHQHTVFGIKFIDT